MQSCLNDLAIKFNTDKSSLKHNYCPFYEATLPKNPRKLLEIGVLSGASIRMWKEYFPNTEVHGLDLFTDGVPDIEGVVWHKGSQMDEHLLYHIRYNIKPEIIIEDASHNCIAHWVTLYNLIGCCDMYIIEDLFTCNEPFYQQGLPFEYTILGAMKTGRFPFKFELFEDKIAVIYK